jgi:hypothetical protein
MMLTKHPKLRDSVEGLYFAYLGHIGYNVNSTIKDLLMDMSKRRIPYIDVFGRLSRKIQEEHPHLRGVNYGKRKKEKEPEVKKQIKNLKI